MSESESKKIAGNMTILFTTRKQLSENGHTNSMRQMDFTDS